MIYVRSTIYHIVINYYISRCKLQVTYKILYVRTVYSLANQQHATGHSARLYRLNSPVITVITLNPGNITVQIFRQNDITTGATIVNQLKPFAEKITIFFPGYIDIATFHQSQKSVHLKHSHNEPTIGQTL